MTLNGLNKNTARPSISCGENVNGETAQCCLQVPEFGPGYKRGTRTYCAVREWEKTRLASISKLIVLNKNIPSLCQQKSALVVLPPL